MPRFTGAGAAASSAVFPDRGRLRAIPSVGTLPFLYHFHALKHEASYFLQQF